MPTYIKDSNIFEAYKMIGFLLKLNLVQFLNKTKFK